MGELLDGGNSRPAYAQDMAWYERMREQQAQHRVPLLQRHDNPHEYLFIALFDGSGQDVNDLNQLPTNIGELWKQAHALGDDPDNRIGAHYVPGVGTQKNPITRAVDGALAYTWDDKIKAMYRELAAQVSDWQQQDPDAQIRLAEVGYSRGAVLVPGFARLVDRYGIADPDTLSFGRDAHGNLTVESSRTLVPPGEIAQAVGLFDPVATNLPPNYDARLPPSVISGFSILALDEQRELFPHQTILAPQMSLDRRFLGSPAAGGHSNVGGGNRDAGLEVQAFNAMADYLNALRDRPMFAHRPVPSDARQYTIYQARGVTAVWGARLDSDGERDLRTELANCTIVDICRDAEPMNQQLAQQFEWRDVQLPPAERTPELPSREQTQALTPEAPARAPAPAQPEGPVAEQQSREPPHDTSPGRRTFDRQRYLEVGNIPVSPAFFTELDTTPSSSLGPVHRLDHPDRMHELTLLREVTLVNERTVRELAQPVRTWNLEVPQRTIERALEDLTQEPRHEAQAIELTRTHATPTPRHAASAPVERDDPRHPLHDDHALYTLLRDRVPDACEERLAQFTAACHMQGITNRNLGKIYPFEETGQIWFESSDLVWSGFARVDMTKPVPTQEEMHAQVQAYDQQQAIEQAEFQAQRAQSQQQQGPVMGGPTR